MIPIYSYDILRKLYLTGMKSGKLYDVLVLYPGDRFAQWVPLTHDIMERVLSHNCEIIDHRLHIYSIIDFCRLEDMLSNRTHHDMAFHVKLQNQINNSDTWVILDEYVLRLCRNGYAYTDSFRYHTGLHNISKNIKVRGAVCTHKRYNHIEPINISKK